MIFHLTSSSSSSSFRCCRVAIGHPTGQTNRSRMRLPNPPSLASSRPSERLGKHPQYCLCERPFRRIHGRILSTMCRQDQRMVGPLRCSHQPILRACKQTHSVAVGTQQPNRKPFPNDGGGLPDSSFEV